LYTEVVEEVAVGIIGIDHVQLAMPPGRESEAVAFYVGALGLDQEAKPAHLAGRGGCWFRRGEVRIHLGVEDDFHPAHKAHPALLVDDLAGLESHLAALDLSTTRDQPLAGYDRCYVADPFGNRIELMQRL
jgi:catechol 2,3-dioxygenase-like lactoylglutathione lyase family enzyme